VNDCGYSYYHILLALTPKEIREFFVPIINLADYLKRVHNSKKLKNIQDAPVVTVSCLLVDPHASTTQLFVFSFLHNCDACFYATFMQATHFISLLLKEAVC